MEVVIIPRSARAVALLVVLAFLSACGGSSHSTHALSGTLDTHTGQTATLPPNATQCLVNCPPMPVGPKGYCAASGYEDIPATGGVEVKVEDGNGKVLGTAALSAGVYGEPSKAIESGQLANSDCRYTFSITTVPETPTYVFSVAGHTSVATLSLAQMKAKQWNVSLALGEVVNGS